MEELSYLEHIEAKIKLTKEELKIREDKFLEVFLVKLEYELERITLSLSAS